MILCFLAFAPALLLLLLFFVLFSVNICSYYFVGYHRRPALMGIRLLWQPAIVVIVTDDDCVIVYYLANKLSLSPKSLSLHMPRFA